MSENKKPPVESPKEKVTPETKKPAGRFSGRPRKARKTITPEQAKAMAEREKQRALDDLVKSQAAEDQKSGETPTLKIEDVRLAYQQAVEQMTAACTAQADKKNKISTLTVERSNLAANLSFEKEKLDVELKQEAAIQIRGFIKELRDVQNALGSVVSDVQSIKGAEEKMASFLTGLTMTSEGLTAVFNKFGTGVDIIPAVEPATVLIKTHAANVPTFLDLAGQDKDMDAVVLNLRVTQLQDKIKQTLSDNEKLDKKIDAAEKALIRGQDSFDHDLKMARQNMEKQKDFVLEKAAKTVLSVADNLGRAMSVLETQKVHLQDMFNPVSERIKKADVELHDAFQKFGLEKVQSLGEKFDPKLHMAVTTMPANGNIKKGDIMQVAEEGYKLNGKLIRDAKVIVAS